MNKQGRTIIFFFIFVIGINQKVYAMNLDLGEKVFFSNCNVCHSDGNNIIIPEKNLKKDTLESNGMNTIGAIMYQVINGKNGMPAFGGRLNENEIEEVAKYVIEKSLINFEN
jgi:cytochrome c6